jgi:GNAT superfamily N-acetyltransferase
MIHDRAVKREIKNVQIREATLSDLPTLVSHRRKMFVAIGSFSTADLAKGDKTYRAWIRKLMVAGEATAFIAETASRRAIGSGAVFLREYDPAPGAGVSRYPHIISMFTEKPYRGQGIATRILEKLVGWARSGDYPIVTLSPGTMEVIRLYKRSGFQRGWLMRMRLKDRPPRPRRRSTR